jgi:phospholipid-binding lipoprotein MlaA
MRRGTLLRLGLTVTALLAVCACATVPRDPVALAAFKATNDPWEPLNRKTFAFNQGVDRAILKPIAKAYIHVVPARGRDGIRNFVKNLGEPAVLANTLLQGQFKRAGTTAGRFVLNSTIGIGGIMDFAGRHGLQRQIGDFGQTLYVWGVHEGPYLVLPIFGPSSPRDAIGNAADVFLNPFVYVVPHYKYRTVFTIIETVLGGIDERARNIDVLDEIQHEAVDFYAAMRSLYRQNRAAELHHGVAPPPPKEDDLYSDPGSDPVVEPAGDKPPGAAKPPSGPDP